MSDTGTPPNQRERVLTGVRRRFIAVDNPCWKQAHASSIVSVGDYRVVAWFAGSREGTADNSIWLSRCGQDGSWQPPHIVASGDCAHWNPVLWRSPDGCLWLFYRRGERISRWRTFVITSHDFGLSWSEPALLVKGDVDGRGPVKNPPVVTSEGSWLAPGSTEKWGDRPIWDCVIDRSVDQGRTWTRHPIPIDRSRLGGAGAIQPSLWSDADGVVYALARSTEGYAYRSRSGDDGRTWDELQPTLLPNNNSGLSVVAAGNMVVCAHNPVAGDWAPRCPLVLSTSDDHGLSWQQRVVIEDGITPVDDRAELIPQLPPDGGFAPADDGVATDGLGEYSYPSICLIDDTLVLTYTWQRRGIVEAEISLSALRDQTLHRKKSL